jgi:hypothetical protein
MGVPDAELLSNLEHFWTDVWRPSGEFWQANRSERERTRRLAAAAVVEAYAWFSLGVHVGSLPRGPAIKLMQRGERWLSEASGVLANLRRATFSAAVWNDVAQAIDGSPFLGHSSDLKEVMSNQPSMRRLLLWWASSCWPFALDKLAGEFLSITVLSSGPAYAAIDAQAVSGERIRSLLEDGEAEGSREELVVVGYLRTVRHMQVVSSLFEPQSLPKSVSGIFAGMSRAIGEIHRWRVDLESVDGVQAFDKLTDAVDLVLRRETWDVAQLEDGGFTRGIAVLKGRWKSSFDPPALTQVAGRN